LPADRVVGPRMRRKAGGRRLSGGKAPCQKG
jgi:hypothetical protein